MIHGLRECESSGSMACVEGFEPPTLGLEGPCSHPLSYTQIVTEPRRRSGGSSRIRVYRMVSFEGLVNPYYQPLGHGSLFNGGSGLDSNYRTGNPEQGYSLPALTTCIHFQTLCGSLPACHEPVLIGYPAHTRQGLTADGTRLTATLGRGDSD